MKILSVSAQKPNSTGSGVYLTELVKGLDSLGHEQAVLAGVYESDIVTFPEDVAFYPVYFHTDEIPFAIAGMSDEMPYESTVYGTMTETMVEQFKKGFRKQLLDAVDQFQPDLIVCHHLYLVTALVRDLFPEHKVCGFCHNTDLRQMCKISLEREYIREQVQRLDHIFALHKEQKEEIQRIYEMSDEKISVIGTGFNHHIFKQLDIKKSEKHRLIFAGKLSEKKGVISLIRSLCYLPWKESELELYLAGGYGTKEEYRKITALAEAAKYPVYFLGRLSQEQLAVEYNKSQIFVLPSFFEGMPLTMMEAMACGNRVVITDLPGIRPWVEEKIVDAPVTYVEPPQMIHTDEPVKEALPAFEKRLAEAIVESVEQKCENSISLDRISWDSVCQTMLTKMNG